MTTCETIVDVCRGTDFIEHDGIPALHTELKAYSKLDFSCEALLSPRNLINQNTKSSHLESSLAQQFSTYHIPMYTNSTSFPTKKGRKVLFPLSRSFAVATPATDSSASTAPGTRTAAGPAAVAATACGAARAARAVSSGWAACTAGPPRGARKPGGRPGVRRSWHVEEKKEESHNAG